MPHLAIDGQACTSVTIVQVYKWLENMPAAIDMTPISPIRIVQTSTLLQGTIFIAESHLMVASYNAHRTFLDVFSCKAFDIPLVVARAIEHFKLTGLTIRVIRTESGADRLDLAQAQFN